VQEFKAERVEGAVNVPFMVQGDAGLEANAKFAGDSHFGVQFSNCVALSGFSSSCKFGENANYRRTSISGTKKSTDNLPA
jgi:hypothetical protein